MITERIYAHIVHPKNGLITTRPLLQVPRIGEEIRLSETRFVKVISIIWVFDEPECCYEQRVNIGVEDIHD